MTTCNFMPVAYSVYLRVGKHATINTVINKADKVPVCQ